MLVNGCLGKKECEFLRGFQFYNFLMELDMEDVEELAAEIRRRLREFIVPDSRFQYDTSSFIPDFAGSEAATHRLVTSLLYRDADMLFVTPDNALLALRAQLIRDRKAFVYPSYGLVRGFRIYEPATRLPPEPWLAASLDGLEHYARPIGLDQLAEIAPCDLVVAGASAVGANGTRFGMGYHYLDCEWPMLSVTGFLREGILAVTIVHDCQLADRRVDPPVGHAPVHHAYTPVEVRYFNPTTSADRSGAPAFPEEIAGLPVFEEFLALQAR